MGIRAPIPGRKGGKNARQTALQAPQPHRDHVRQAQRPETGCDQIGQVPGRLPIRPSPRRTPPLLALKLRRLEPECATTPGRAPEAPRPEGIGFRIRRTTCALSGLPTPQQRDRTRLLCSLATSCASIRIEASLPKPVSTPQTAADPAETSPIRALARTMPAPVPGSGRGWPALRYRRQRILHIRAHRMGGTQYRQPGPD